MPQRGRGRGSAVGPPWQALGGAPRSSRLGTSGAWALCCLPSSPSPETPPHGPSSLRRLPLGGRRVWTARPTGDSSEGPLRLPVSRQDPPLVRPVLPPSLRVLVGARPASCLPESPAATPSRTSPPPLSHGGHLLPYPIRRMCRADARRGGRARTAPCMQRALGACPLRVHGRSVARSSVECVANRTEPAPEPRRPGLGLPRRARRVWLCVLWDV